MIKKQHCYVIYKHTNKNTGMCFIGQTHQDPIKTWGTDGSNYSSNAEFFADISKYGWDCFSHEILETNLTKEQADERENYYIHKFNAIDQGYNIKYVNNNIKKSRGRPKVDRSDKILRAFETTIPLDNRLIEESIVKGISVSALIRQILEKHYEER